MDKAVLQSKKLPELRDLAKMLGIEGTETFKKAELIDVISQSESKTTVESDDKPKRKRARKRVMTEENPEKKTQTSLFKEEISTEKKEEPKAVTSENAKPKARVEKTDASETSVKEDSRQDTFQRKCGGGLYNQHFPGHYACHRRVHNADCWLHVYKCVSHYPERLP